MTIKEEAAEYYKKCIKWYKKFKPFNSRKRSAVAQIDKDIMHLHAIRIELLKLEKHEVL